MELVIDADISAITKKTRLIRYSVSDQSLRIIYIATCVVVSDHLFEGHYLQVKFWIKLLLKAFYCQGEQLF